MICILVCPVITKGTREKDIVFPAGAWQDTSSIVYEGRSTVRLRTDLDKLLWFRRIK